MTITYTTGDATNPQGEGQKIIAHIVNDQGAWGSGFVVALSRRNRLPEDAYRTWYRTNLAGFNTGTSGGPFKLGQMQMVDFADSVWVANMVAQRGIRHNPSAPRAVDYDALKAALDKVAGYATRGLGGASVHMPRIGCGLGGGTWDEIEPIIQSILIAHGIPVTVYDLKGA